MSRSEAAYAFRRAVLKLSHPGDHAPVLLIGRVPLLTPRCMSAAAQTPNSATRLHTGALRPGGKLRWSLDELLRKHPQAEVALVEPMLDDTGRQSSHRPKEAWAWLPRAKALQRAAGRALTYLRLGAELPPWLPAQAGRLAVLDMSGCRLAPLALLPTLGSLTALVVLHLSSTEIRQLPHSLGRPTLRPKAVEQHSQH